MTVEGVSGSNIVTDNDGNATLTTGDIELIANMLNILNLNITGEDFLHLIVNIFGQLNGTIDLDDIAAYLGLADDDDLEIIARNENTGEDSENTVETTVLETTNVNNVNNAEVNNEMNVSDFNLFTQYIYAVDGAVKRDGFYIQPSYVIGLNSESAFFNSIRLLYRFNTLDVRANDVSDNLPTSPFTWDRQTHSVAVNLQIHSYVLFRNEYHFNLEATGADRNKVSNNEFLSQLEVRF